MLQYLVLVSVVAGQVVDLNPAKQLECLKLTIQKKCPNENVTFWLYNDLTTDYHLNDFNISTIEQAPFNDRPIKILLHGFIGNKTFDPNPQIRPEYLRLKYNVISVDYGLVVKGPCYIQSVPNSKVVGDCFAEFIHLLLNTTIEKRASKKITSAEIHVIGFSLGGQVAGDMGNKMQEKHQVLMPRITALDPAAPLFWATYSRVNKTSAKFVDCLHTNSGLFGKLLPLGTVDVYFNQILFQDGCSPLDVDCNHLRAPEYFAESISTTDHKFCGKNTVLTNAAKVLIGEYVSPATKGIYYVKTNSTKPFAIDAPTDC